MKILYLHQYFGTPSTNGGTRSYEMARRFVKKGHSVTILTSSALLSANHSFNRGWNKLRIKGISLYVLHLPYSNKDSFVKRICKFVYFSLRSTKKAIGIQSDIVFATSTPLTIAIPGLFYSKVRRVPLVFEVRDLWPELPVAVGAIKNPILIWCTKWFEKYTYNNSKKIVGLSPGMCKGIIDCGISSKHVVNAPNSCDVKLFDVHPNIGENYIVSNLLFLKRRKLVVYTGTFGLINDVGYLAKLAKNMIQIDPNICFIAVGDGMQKKKVMIEAKNLCVLNNNLYFLPRMAKTEIVKLLSAADLSLSLFAPIPEMWNNSANKFFDALASATPIGINYGGWQKDILNQYNCGVVLDSIDHKNAAIQLAAFINDEKRLKLAKVQCRNIAYNIFSRDIVADLIEKTLQDALDGH